MGGTMTDKNCERLKLARGIYDMGMKVAAVSIMCQDERVFTAMMNAGTPCPVDGKIGESAKAIWEENPERKPKSVKSKD
jgi:metal-sulfur cluster biosynthetic enzyme